jgi:hypothetical protein
VPLFLGLMLALAVPYLLPTPDVRAEQPNPSPTDRATDAP